MQQLVLCCLLLLSANVRYNNARKLDITQGEEKKGKKKKKKIGSIKREREKKGLK
jgi:hypothetical protein